MDEVDLMATSLYCPECNAENEPLSRFCNACGQPFKGDPTSLIGSHMTAPTHAAPVPQAASSETGSGSGLLVPDSILQGRYRITQLLGQGGMGAVYLASDARFSARTCVIKEMLDHFNDPEQRAQATESFHREADLLASFKHAGIPEVYDRFTEANRHYLVMEYINGIDLEQRLLDNGGPFSEKEVIEWAIQCCDVLSYLHHQKPPVIYRDMKPANVITTHWGKVYLVDFGIARFFNPVTRGTMIGTQGYAPPEQYRGQVDPRSDLYALGATIHYLLTGRDPQNEPPFSFPPVTTLNPDISPEMEMLVLKALDPEAENRFASADEMLGQLMAIGGDASDVVRDCPHCGFRSTVTRQFCPNCKQYISKKAHVLKPQQGSGAIVTDAAGIHQTKISGKTAGLHAGNRAATGTIFDGFRTDRVDWYEQARLRFRLSPVGWSLRAAAGLLVAAAAGVGLWAGMAYVGGPTLPVSEGATLLTSDSPTTRAGTRAYAAGDMVEAADAFKRATAEVPGDAEAQIYWRNALLKLGRVSTVRIAVAGNFSGGSGGDLLRGVAQAQREVNERERSPKVVVVLADDGGDPKQALRNAERLNQDSALVALVAGSTASTDASTLQLLGLFGLPVVSPTQHGEGHPQGTGSLLQLGAEEGQVATALLDHLQQAGKVRRVLNVDSATEGAGGLSETFARIAEERGVEVVATRAPIDAGALVAALKKEPAEAVMVGDDLDLALSLAGPLTGSGLKVKIVGGPGLYAPDRIREANRAAEGLVAVTPFHTGGTTPQAREFELAFRDAFQAEPGPEAALGYEGVKLVVRSLDLRSPLREDVSAALRKLTQQGYEGLSGRVTVSTAGVVQRPLTLARVRSGRFEALRVIAP